MLGTQIRQKDSRFYFVSYPADDLLRRVRFISRYYGEGETIQPTAPRKDDEVAAFIARIEHSDKAFQRQLARRKVKAIQDFYAEAVNQPPIPGAILLFTPRRCSSSRSAASTTSATWRNRASRTWSSTASTAWPRCTSFARSTRTRRRASTCRA